MNRDFVMLLLSEKRELLRKIIATNESGDFNLPTVIADTPLEKVIMERSDFRRRFMPIKSIYFDYENQYNRFFLLSNEEKRSLGKIISCVVSADIVKNEVRKQYVTSFIDILGKQGYYFALGRGSLYFPAELRDRLSSFFENKLDCLKNSGFLVIESLLDKADEECRSFYNYSREGTVLTLSDEELEQLYKCTVKVLSLEIDKKWQNIFS